MAKKKETLTIEEKLQNALVPDWEQPYKLPENWCWTRLDSVSEIVTGGTPSKKNESYYGGEFPFIKPADLDQGRNTIFASEYLTNEGKNVSRVVRKGSTSVCCIGTIGKSGFLEVEATTNQQINTIIPMIEDLFMYYYSCSNFFVQELVNKASATTISIVNKSKMSETYFPLPPLAEQKRIVDRIESLFSKLDEAKELAENALDSFENRKSAILHKAFTGELTKKWREENGVSFDSWEERTFNELIEKAQNGLAKRNGEGIDTVVLRLADLRENTICEDDLRKIPLTSSEIEKYTLNFDDILLIRVNGSKDNVAKQIMIKENVDFSFCDHLIRIKYNSNIINVSYAVYFSYTSEYRNYIKDNMVSSAGQNTISRKGLSKLIVPTPQLLEQQEIVRILDSIFEKETEAKELVSVIDKIDLIKKSILSKAFRGELGTNDVNEESSVGLLREILLQNTPKEIRKYNKKIIINQDVLLKFKTDLEEQIYRFILEKKQAALEDILSIIPSSKQLDAMLAITTLYESKLINEKDNIFFVR